MAGIDLNRTSAGAADLLPSSISQEIWANTVEASTVMSLSRRINLPAGGLTIPMITGDAEADWVNETDEKPVSDATVGSKSMKGYKIAVIEAFSNEFERDLPALYAELARRLPSALGRRFDQTVLHGTAPGSDFDVLTGAPTAAVSGDDLFGDFLSAYQTVALAGGDVSGWALSPQAEALALQSKDTNGNYLFIQDVSAGGAVGRILGQPVYKSRAAYAAGTPNTLGVVGDFNSAIVGIVSDVAVSRSDQATITKNGTPLNLWQRNMFAIRAEVEIGFIVRDVNHFVRLTDAAA